MHFPSIWRYLKAKSSQTHTCQSWMSKPKTTFTSRPVSQFANLPACLRKYLESKSAAANRPLLYCRSTGRYLIKQKTLCHSWPDKPGHAKKHCDAICQGGHGSPSGPCIHRALTPHTGSGMNCLSEAGLAFATSNSWAIFWFRSRERSQDAAAAAAQQTSSIKWKCHICAYTRKHAETSNVHLGANVLP